MKFDLILKDATSEDVMKVLSVVSDGISIPVIVNNTSSQPLNVGQPLPNTAPLQTSHSAVQATEANNEDTASAEDVTGQVDKDGFTWDARIHSGNKKMTAKGVWTRRRGVSDSEVETVEAELRAKSQPVQFQPAPQFVQNTIEQFGGGGQLPVVDTSNPNYAAIPNGGAMPVFAPPQPEVIPYQQPAPAPVYTPPAPVFTPPQPEQVQYQQPVVAQQPAPAPAPVKEIDFNGLMQHFQNQFNKGIVTQDYLNHLSDKCGANSITDLAARPDLIKYAVSVMQSEGKW